MENNKKDQKHMYKKLAISESCWGQEKCLNIKKPNKIPIHSFSDLEDMTKSCVCVRNMT